MIPSKLHLHNFLSYRDEELSFDGISLTSIAGDNGNGKSALIDAITWVLWGEARKASGQQKPDDDLLNRTAESQEGATEMYVSLSFRSQGVEYIARRSYRKTASGKTTTSDLELKQEGGKDLTASTQKETQKLITNIVGMSYELFTSTCLFLQGEWDRFLSATPSERKEMLFDLLQMQEYQKIEEKAKDKRRELRREVTEAEGRVGYLHEQLQEKKRDYDSLISDVDTEQSEVQDKLEAVEELSEEDTALREQAKTLENDIRNLETQLRQAKKNKEQAASKIQQLEQQIQKWESKKQDLPSKDALEDRIDSKDEISRKITERKESITEKKQAEQKAKSLQDKVSRMKWAKRRAIQSKEEEIAAIEDRLLEEATVEIYEDQLEGYSEDEAREYIQEQQEKKEEAEQAVSAAADEIQEERLAISKIETQIESAEDQIAYANDSDVCQLCGSTLTAEHTNEIVEDKEQLARNLQQEKQVHEDNIESLTASREEAEDKARSAGSEIHQTEDSIDHLNEVQKELDAHQEQSQKLRDVQEALEDVKAGNLSEAGFDKTISEVQKEESEAAARAEGLSDDQEALDDLQAEKDRIKDAEYTLKEHKTCANRISESQADKESYEGTLEDETQLAHELTSDIEAKQETLQDVNEQIEELGFDADRLDALTQRVHSLENKKQKLLTQRDVYQQLQSDHSMWSKKKRELIKTESAADLLCEGFGKNGVPSLVLSAVVPQIEAQTNQFLDVLTEGRYQIKLQTVREKKTGGLADTFNIVVIEGGHKRPYESLSGGESFRVSFALRVALSKHVAAQTGTPIQTLIIDEGFGTQDQDGLRAVQETIAKAATSFEKVFVITHIAYLRDAFPSQIYVDKGPNGSHVHIS